MSSMFVGFLSIFFLLYGVANYYVGLRIWQSFSYFFTPNYTKIYCVTFCIVAASPFFSRLSSAYFVGVISDTMTLIGNYWLAAIYYFTLLWLLVDVFRFVGKKIGLQMELLTQHHFIPGAFVLLVVSVALGYGSWNARHPQIHHYDITIAKEAGALSELHVVMVSDIHLGSIVDNKRLEGMVSMINQLHPDVVLVAGDIIDENVNYFAEQRMPDTFRKLTSRFGTYAVFGNHDYLGGHAEEVGEYLRSAGVVVLRDEYVKINEDFYIVGRDDRTRQRMTGKLRKELPDIMQGMNHATPILMLDHQPYHLEEGLQQGVDLQLSGHTHHGQFFPNNLITNILYEQDWGYLKKEEYQVIVSSGFGTWGPPIRIGNTPEVVDIVIRFTGSKEH